MNEQQISTHTKHLVLEKGCMNMTGCWHS